MPLADWNEYHLEFQFPTGLAVPFLLDFLFLSDGGGNRN